MPGGVQFANPWVLAALALVPVLALVHRHQRPERLGGGVVLSTLAPLEQVRPSRRLRLRPVLVPLRLLALALLIVGLARPQTVEADATIAAEGIDIVLALDISGSMQDAGLGAAKKLDAAKAALKQFLATRKDDRVGLVVFKSESRQLSPLTTDYTALAQLVDHAAQLGQNLAEGTAIGLGLSDALNLLRNSHARSRVIILATDGENNVHTVEPETAGKVAATLKMRVYTIGIPTAGTRTDLSLDEKLMRTIAEGTGGSYVRAANTQGFTEVITGIATLEKSRVEREHFTRSTELAPYCLVSAFALVVLEVLLGATAFRRAP